MTSKNNIILAAFLIVAVIYLGYIVYTTYFFKEHFVDGQHLNDYEARMHVMSVFDTVLKRKPTADEIDKYAVITNEQDMLVAVLADYKALPPLAATTTPAKGVVNDEEKIVETLNPAPVPPTSATPSTPSSSKAGAKTANSNINLKEIETSLSTIHDMVALIRTQLYTQVMCESEDSVKSPNVD